MSWGDKICWKDLLLGNKPAEVSFWWHTTPWLGKKMHSVALRRTHHYEPKMVVFIVGPSCEIIQIMQKYTRNAAGKPPQTEKISAKKGVQSFWPTILSSRGVDQREAKGGPAVQWKQAWVFDKRTIKVCVIDGIGLGPLCLRRLNWWYTCTSEVSEPLLEAKMKLLTFEWFGIRHFFPRWIE